VTKFILALFGMGLGAVIGGAIGIAAGFVWTSVLHTSCFEGYCGMLIFFTFGPIGALSGAGLALILALRLSKPVS
jgi:hypothetical protein